MNLKLQQGVLRRQIKQNGKEYVFYRYGKNKFGEIDKEVKEEININGIFHESNGYVSVTTEDGAQYRSKKSPMIIAAFEDASKILIGDFLEYNGKVYEVTEITDINDFGIAGDISLEVKQ